MINRARYLRQRILERLDRTDVVRAVEPNELGLDPRRSVGYANSGDGDLARVFRSLGIVPTDSIVDLGCGKGGALRVCASFPFHRIVGVELSGHLCAVARANVQRWGLGRVEIVEADAADFDCYQSISHVYMFNPFRDPVVAAVIRRIEHSLVLDPRPFTIVYKAPTCHEEIVSSGRFRQTAEYPSKVTRYRFPFRIYSADP